MRRYLDKLQEPDKKKHKHKHEQEAPARLHQLASAAAVVAAAGTVGPAPFTRPHALTHPQGLVLIGPSTCAPSCSQQEEAQPSTQAGGGAPEEQGKGGMVRDFCSPLCRSFIC